MLRNLRWKAVGMALLAAGLWAGAPVSRAEAEGMAALKLGWTYNIGFPESLQDQENPKLGVSAGVNAYRIMGFGGDTWYRVQRVFRHPNGGWFTPPGAPSVWVNMGYAYSIQEATK